MDSLKTELLEMVFDANLPEVEAEALVAKIENLKSETLLNAYKKVIVKKIDDYFKTNKSSKPEKTEKTEKSEPESLADSKSEKKKKNKPKPPNLFDELSCKLNIEVTRISKSGYELEPVILEGLRDQDGSYNAKFYEILDTMKNKLTQFFQKSKDKITLPMKLNAILLNEYAYVKPLHETYDIEVMRRNIMMSFEITNVHMLTTSYISKLIVEIEKAKIDFEQSGYTLLQFREMVFNKATMPAMKGGKYIECPKNKFCINFKNDDDKCFYYNACLFEFLKENKRYNHKNNFKHILNYESKFNFENINFPTQTSDYDLFSEQNKQNLIIYEEDEDGEVCEIYRSEQYDTEYLGMKLIHGENMETSHLLYITDLCGYLNKNKKSDHDVFCPKCLRYYTANAIQYHDCKERSTKFYKYEEKESLKVGAADYDKELPTFTRVYADFESINDTLNGKVIQRPITVGYKLVNEFCPELNTNVKIIHGRNCVEKFLKKLLKYNKKSKKEYKMLREKHQLPNLSEEEEIEFQKCKACNFCGKDDEPLVRDHCHLSGKYRQALCNACNINFHDRRDKQRKREGGGGGLIVMFHNSRSYDTHLIMRELYKVLKEKEQIQAIATTIDKYITFSFRGMRFLDTYLFLNSSLGELCDTMEHKDFTRMNKYFGENSIFLRQKQLYPYSWVDDEEKFNHPGLPEKKYFYNDLRKEDCNDNDYDYATNVYVRMDCQKFLDYHKLYLKVDVLTMCDIFEKFRVSQKNDPYNCPTINSLSWSMMMRTCRQELGYIKNDYQRVFLGKGQRGGICQTGVKKHVRANNKYMTKFNKDKRSSFIIYVDMNGLYGGVMQDEYLPYKLINDEPEYVTFDEIMKMGNEIGCFVKLNIYYPTDEKQREYIRGYTPFPCKHETHFNDLSEEQRSYFLKNKKCNQNTDFFGGSKLIMDFRDKKEYVVHYKYLQYIESKKLGFTFEPCSDKGYEVLKFHAKQWLKPYISQNAEKRKHATNEVEKAFWKLCSNAIYGKMQEKVDERKNFDVTNDYVKAQKLIQKDTHCMGYSIKDENDEEKLFFNLNLKKVIKYDKFQYIGNAILDLSKLHMMKYYYDYLKPKYNENLTFLYTDTDSIIFKVYCEDFYADCYEDRANWYDLSNVKIKKFEYKTNKGVNGKMKLEDKMIPITEAVFLNPKVYCCKFDEKFYTIKQEELKEEMDKKIDKLDVDEYGNKIQIPTINEKRNFVVQHIIKTFEESIENIKIDKGTKKGVTKSIHIPIDDYVDVCKSKVNKSVDVTQLKSKHHTIIVENMNKIALTPYDTKVLTVGNESRQFGF